MVAALVLAAEHILVQPGGTREGCRSFRHRYQVDWGDRLGYVRLAIRHGLRIVPIAGQGVDDAFVGLNDGYALGRRFRLPANFSLWFGVGLTGFWPLLSAVSGHMSGHWPPHRSRGGRGDGCGG